MGARSIYDDPRATRFPSPPPSLDRSHSDVAVSASRDANAGAKDAHTTKPRSQSQLNWATSSRPSESASPSGSEQLKHTGASTPAGDVHRGPDRSLRVNLMAACVPNQRRNRNSAGPAATGRLNCMAKGTKGRYVVGGSQCELLARATADTQTFVCWRSQIRWRRVPRRRPNLVDRCSGEVQAV